MATSLGKGCHEPSANPALPLSLPLPLPPRLEDLLAFLAAEAAAALGPPGVFLEPPDWAVSSARRASAHNLLDDNRRENRHAE